MAISIKAVTCPQCGASVKCEEGREKLFCSYCGALIVVSNDNEHIYRHIDEADIKRAETERIETLANIRANEEMNKSTSTAKWIKLIVIGILLVLGILLMIIGSMDNPMLSMVGMIVLEIAGFVGLSFIPGKNKGNNGNRQNTTSQNGIRISSAVANYYGSNYEAISALLKSSGFTNISCIPLKDITLLNALTFRKGQIETLSINGNEKVREGDLFPADATIVITYHSSPSESAPNVTPVPPVSPSNSNAQNQNNTQQAQQQTNMKCSNCGGTMMRDNTTGLVVCQFCGSSNATNPSPRTANQQTNSGMPVNNTQAVANTPNLFISFNTSDPRVGMVTRIVSTGVKSSYTNGTTLSYVLTQGPQTIVLKIGRINYNRDIVIPANNTPVKIYASYNGRAQISIDQPAY